MCGVRCVVCCDRNRPAQLRQVHVGIPSVLQQPPRPSIKLKKILGLGYTKHPRVTCQEQRMKQKQHARTAVLVNGIAKFPVYGRQEMLGARQRDVATDSSVVSIPEVVSDRSDTETILSSSARKAAEEARAQQQRLSVFGSVSIGDVNLNLWSAKPPRYSQYLDMESEHMPGDTSSGTTGTDDTSATLSCHKHRST